MSATGLITEELQPSPTPSPPRRVAGLAVVGLAMAVAGVAVAVLAAQRLRDYNNDGVVSTVVGAVLVVLSLYPLLPAFKAFAGDRQRSKLLRGGDLVPARRAAAAAREEAQIAMGYAAAALIVAGLLLMAFANDGGVAKTFFTKAAWTQSYSEMIHAFWTNIWASCVAQVLVLLFGLCSALRLLGWCEHRRTRDAVVGLAAFLLALMCKVSAAPFAALIPAGAAFRYPGRLRRARVRLHRRPDAERRGGAADRHAGRRLSPRR